MTERPILFSGPMVRGIIEGRKTQTRRIVFPPNGYRWLDIEVGTMINDGGHKKHITDLPRRHGVGGDRLWVRETCRADELDSGLDGVRYPADGAFRAIEDSRDAAGRWVELYAYRGQTGATVPAIHMPRWVSRITLEITSVRAERLQSISESDARDEGVTIEDHHMRGYCAGAFRPPSIRAFHDLWDSLNASRGYGWETNPWVWVVAFRRIAT
ncbi:hypothetical protein [Burkholderia cenocepacia]|uniref:hypothetical protein n=1 Tax=Burkholderia cenocepacia TaxID=95486 RepID=UPI00265615A8|nr:hypothetical protein [Burkholderia cenocepacia]MDN7544775.1 hypothetical protein [Burkholderia cenocepacia]MDN7626952.1 hypothetical protein [Burkholderia cenocepacia]